MICEQCHNDFDESQTVCPHCKYPYLFKTVCIKCDFKSVKKYISCPKCKAFNRLYAPYLLISFLLFLFILLVGPVFFSRDFSSRGKIYCFSLLIITLGFSSYALVKGFFLDQKDQKRLQLKRKQWDSEK